MAASQAGKKTLSMLFKQGWNEIPEVMGGACMALIGVTLAGIAWYNFERGKGPYYRRFKHDYIVFRDDDPRVKLLRTD